MANFTRRASCPLRTSPTMAIPGSLGGSFEVMSGKGGWSSAMERVGFTGERGDWMDDVNSPHNYLVEENRLSLERRIANKEFKFVHVGLECLTFSTASGGCYRSKVHLLGKPNLKPHLQHNVNDHNMLATWTVKLFQLCINNGVGASVEHPNGSVFWHWPAVKVLIEKCFWVRTDYCMWNCKKVKKPTRILSTYPLAVLERLCTHAPKSHRHQLQGTVKFNGKYMAATKMASPYPPKLCAAWATACAHIARSGLSTVA